MAFKDEIYTIDKKVSKQDASDFYFLREKAIELIESFAGKKWTDYNLHDPGITILEALCYAITDLSYKTNFNITDLLANSKGEIDNAANCFFPKDLILTTNPVSINDLRKVIIDALDEVTNVWIEPAKSNYSQDSVKGIYNVYAQLKKEVVEKLYTGEEAAETLAYSIATKIKEAFLSVRNVCEDLESIILLTVQEIKIEADVLVDKDVFPEDVLANVYNEIQKHLNPIVHFYTESELLAKGYTIEEIYSGPLLENGIIPDSELTDQVTEVDPAELIKIILQVPGVMAVKSLAIVDAGNYYTSKPFPLQKNSFPYLKVTPSDRGIKLFSDNLERFIKWQVMSNILQKIQTASKRSFVSAYQKLESFQYSKGEYRDVGNYFSIQNNFPVIYEIGPDGVPSDESQERKGLVKQLKAYLLFFEQIMANYLAQLEHVQDFFSPYDPENLPHTYFFKNVYNVPGVEDLLADFPGAGMKNKKNDWEKFKRDTGNDYLKNLQAVIESDDVYNERKERVLNHLLARFNETVYKYPLIIYNRLYNQPATDRVGSVIKWQSSILKDQIYTSSSRIKGFDYWRNYEDAELTFGFERKISKLLYLQNTKKGRLVGVAPEQSSSMSMMPSASDEQLLQKRIKYETVWIQDEELTIMSREEDAQDDQTAFIFQNQSVSFFKTGMDINNYRVLEDNSVKGKYMVIYKAPNETRWLKVSAYADKQTANEALAKVITGVVQMNIDSEGFHIIEQILLRPDLDKKKFGFRFYDLNGKVLLQHKEWLSFIEREILITDLLHAIGAQPFDDLITNFKGKFKLLVRQDDKEKLVDLDNHPDFADKSIKASLQLLADSLSEFKKTNTKSYARFEYFFTCLSKYVIKEELFSYKMTVVFSSWSARFSDQGFRKFAENVVRENAPAYVNVNPVWLGVSQMNAFEDLYFKWLNALKKDGAISVKEDLAEQLLWFLISKRIITTEFYIITDLGS
ncbi:hypothetical protein ACI6Q2_08465 [Chitinophagaceae bacterium LWZ2-11]